MLLNIYSKEPVAHKEDAEDGDDHGDDSDNYESGCPARKKVRGLMRARCGW